VIAALRAVFAAFNYSIACVWLAVGMLVACMHNVPRARKMPHVQKIGYVQKTHHVQTFSRVQKNACREQRKPHRVNIM